MIRVPLWAISVAFAGLLATAASAGDSPSPPQLASRALVDALQTGGYVIYIRHAATERAQVDAEHIDFENCATQRNLSMEGRQQARDIGAAFKALGLRVDKVMSSPYCRAKETARLAFGEFVASDELGFTMRDDEARTKHRAAALRELLATPPAHGRNSVIVAHSSNLKEAAGIWPKDEGVAVVFRPNAGGAFEPVATIDTREWAALARPR